MRVRNAALEGTGTDLLADVLSVGELRPASEQVGGQPRLYLRPHLLGVRVGKQRVLPACTWQTRDRGFTASR
ncbi:MAG: hypothetical protein QOE64_1543, partial [Frankiales bacterium]|nr:hypothetical protein [Frankiales bacterium]